MSDLNKNNTSYYFDSIEINGSKILFAWSDKFESEVLKYDKAEFQRNLNKYTSKLKRAEFEAGNSSIFKVSMEIKNLTCNKIQNIQKQLDSKLYQLIDYDPLITEFDNKLQVSNSHIKMPFYTHKNSEFWNSLIMKKKNKRCSIRQVQYLSWLFNENRDWIDQLYIFQYFSFELLQN